VPERCTVRVVASYIYIVLAFNFVKVATLLYILYTIRENPLLTIGDAVKSFLTIPDSSTKGRCLMTKADVKSWIDAEPPKRQRISGDIKRWHLVISNRRWWIIILL